MAFHLGDPLSGQDCRKSVEEHKLLRRSTVVSSTQDKSLNRVDIRDAGAGKKGGNNPTSVQLETTDDSDPHELVISTSDPEEMAMYTALKGRRKLNQRSELHPNNHAEHQSQRRNQLARRTPGRNRLITLPDHPFVAVNGRPTGIIPFNRSLSLSFHRNVQFKSNGRRSETRSPNQDQSTTGIK